MTDYKRFKGPLDSKRYPGIKSVLPLNLDPSTACRTHSESEG